MGKLNTTSMCMQILLQRWKCEVRNWETHRTYILNASLVVIA